MKKLVKILAWLVGIVIVLMILVVVGVKLFLPAEKIRAMAVEEATAKLGRPVNVGSLDVSFWGGLGVRLVDVTVASPEEMNMGDLLAADNIDVKLQLWPLLSGEYRIDRLIINGPKIVMVKKADGQNNYSFPTLEEEVPPQLTEGVSPETKAAAAAVTFDRLEINDGLVDYVDDSSQLSLHLAGLDLSTSLEIPRENIYQSSGRIAADTFLVTTDEPLPPLAVELQYSADYDMSQGEIVLHESQATINGLKFEISGRGNHTVGAANGRASVRSHEVKVADLFALMPPEQLTALEGFELEGAFDFEVDLAYDETKAEPLSYSGNAVISDLEMSKNDIPGKLRFKRALVDFEPDNLRMNIEEGSFDGRPLSGQVAVKNFDDPTLNGQLAGQSNLAFAQPFLPAEDKHQLNGDMAFDVAFSGLVSDPASMQFSGDLSVEKGSYQSLLLPQPVESFSLEASVNNTLARVRKLELHTPDGNLTFAGSINNLVPYLMADSADAAKVVPSVDGNIKGGVDLAMFGSFLDQESNPALTGRVEMDLNLSGSADRPANFKPRGSVSIADASYNDNTIPEPLEKFTADLVISPDTVTVKNWTVEFTSSDASLSGKLIDPLPYLLPLEIVDQSKVKKPLFVFELSSHRFDVDRLFPEAVPGSGSNRSTLPADSVPPIILPDINGRGTLAIDTLIYSQVNFTNIKGKVVIKDRKITCHNVTGDVYTGKVEGNTTIDLTDFENPVYTGEYHASQVEADDFISRFTNFGGYVFGKIDLNGTYDARGWEPDQFLNSLSMDGAADMKKGVLKTSGASHKLLSNLASQLGETIDAEQALKDASTKLYVKDGRIGLDKLLTALGDLGDLELIGSIGFDKSLDFSGSLLLTKARSEQLFRKYGALSTILGGSGGRLKVPLAFGGTTDKPTFNIDFSSIQDNLGKNLKDQVGGAIKDLFKK